MFVSTIEERNFWYISLIFLTIWLPHGQFWAILYLRLLSEFVVVEPTYLVPATFSESVSSVKRDFLNSFN